MARYLIRVKGETEVSFRLFAESISELQDLVDAEDDPAAFEFTEDRKNPADRNWRSVVPVGQTYIPGLGCLPSVVAEMDCFAATARYLGCGRSE